MPRTFWLVWAADAVSKAGDAVSAVAIPLVAITAAGAGPVEMGLLGVAQFAPVVALTLPAGAWVDRQRSQRHVLIATDVMRGAVLGTVPLAWISGGVAFSHLWLVLFGSACLATIADVTFASYVPRLVGRSLLVSANARLELSRSAAQVLGPSVAGALLAVVAAPAVIAIDALSFGGSALFLRGIRRPEPPVDAAGLSARATPLADVRDGVRYVLTEPHLRATTLTAATNNLSRSIATVVAILYLVRDAGVSSADIAAGIALGNTGFIVGAALASRLTQRLGIGRAMRVAVSCFAPGMALLAAAPAALALPALVVMTFLNGFGIALHNVNQVSVRQAATPDGMRGRVAAASRLLIFGALPLGTMLGGILGGLLGLRATLWIGAAGLVLGTVPYRVSRVGGLVSLPEPGGDANLRVANG
jgi:MFS family permease